MKSSSSQFMDKQIMDLSQSNKDLIDLNNPHNDNDDDEQDVTTVVPSYDFHPIRPPRTSSAAADAAAAGGGNGGGDGGGGDSKQRSLSTSPIRSYGSLDTIQPAKAPSLVKERNVFDVDVVSEIDNTMRKYTDNVLHALEGVSARLTQLETRTHHLEDSVDDLKASVGNNYGSTDGKMRQLENILREVQTGVKDLKDKQDLVEAQLQLAKLQMSKTEHRSESQNTVHVSSQQAATVPSQPHQQNSPLAPSQPISSLPPNAPLAPSQPISSLPPNAPPPIPTQQNVAPFVQLPNQFPQNQVTSVPTHEPYFQSSGQSQETQPQQYQIPPTQATHPPPMVPPHQQYLTPSQPQYTPPSQPTQQQPSLGPVSSHLHPPSAGQHAEESPYITPPNYPPSIRQPPAQMTSGLPPAQQYYGAPPPIYDSPPSRSNSGLSTGYGPHSETYSYGGSTSQYDSNLSMKPQHSSSLPVPQSAGGRQSHLPTARVLPQAIPTASGVGSGSGSPRNGSRVPIDDVVDKVTTMGFPRDHVRATVQRLTENGQAVDLNTVLDKLMNDGEVQPPRGWFGR